MTPSYRLKLIRAGRQDYEYLRYLADHGQKDQACSIARRLLSRELCPDTGTPSIYVLTIYVRR